MRDISFPNNPGDIVLINLSQEALPYLIAAIEDDKVKWGEIKAKSGAFRVQEFDFLGFRYEVITDHKTCRHIKRAYKVEVADDDDNDGVTLVSVDDLPAVDSDALIFLFKGRNYNSEWGGF